MSDQKDRDITIIVGTSDCLRKYIKIVISECEEDMPCIYDRIIDSFDTLKDEAENNSHNYNRRYLYLTTCVDNVDEIKKIKYVKKIIYLDWVLDGNRRKFVLEKTHLLG